MARKNHKELFRFRCRKCGTEFESAHRDGRHRKCPKCFPKTEGVSKEETELADFVAGIAGGRIVRGSRSVIFPRELDVFVPDKKIAVEFDGLFWHSDAHPGIDAGYHLAKTEACEKLGIRLIHVFEDEWLEKRKIVESRLKDLFGIHEKTVYARKCRVREVDREISRHFLDENHIQGAVGASVRLGLYSRDELISLMTFGKPRFSKKYEWEMLRFCSKTGCHVPGAAGKLLKYFERTRRPGSIVSYADRRWSRGGLYGALGFEPAGKSPPNYWYVSNVPVRLSRVRFQKHRLKDVLENFDESLTEVENARNNGYFRVFDCGNFVFVRKYGGRTLES